MIQNKGIGRHLVFWLVYFAVNLFNELFLSSSFTNNPSLHLILLAASAQLLTLTVKVPLVYIVLYILIPKWFSHSKKTVVLLEGVGIFFLAMVLHRLIIQVIVWKYIYHSVPPEMTSLQQTARLFYSLLDLLQVTGIAAAIKLFRMRIRAVKNERLLVQEKLQAEMMHLKSQINPHFLFNTLNTIFSLSRSKSDDTPDSVMRLSNILRYMIYETGQKTASIGDELKIIDDYIDLQKLRFGKRVAVKTDWQVDHPSTRVAPLLILPLVENAFKHGVETAAGNTSIDIKIDLQGSRLSLTITNPVSKQAADKDKEQGIGLVNIRRQLELLYREYRFEHENQNDLFVVNLWINLESYAGFELFDRGR